MREELRDPLRIKHMIEAIHRVEDYMRGKSQADLSEDSLLFYGVVKNIEIVGEAAYMLTDVYKHSHPLTPWRHIIAMRHILVHGYYKVSTEEVYSVYKEDLPGLLAQLEEYVEEF